MENNIAVAKAVFDKHSLPFNLEGALRTMSVIQTLNHRILKVQEPVVSKFLNIELVALNEALPILLSELSSIKSVSDNKLYLLRQNENCDIDTTNACVICATSAEEALDISFNEFTFRDWAVNRASVVVQFIGVASEDIPVGRVL